MLKTNFEDVKEAHGDAKMSTQILDYLKELKESFGQLKSEVASNSRKEEQFEELIKDTLGYQQRVA